MSPKELPSPAKKGAKKVAKKAAKKGAKGPGHHLRRGYEHLRRLHTLARQLTAEDLALVEVLSQYAQAAFREGDVKTAADLLRAGEHLAFAALAREVTDESEFPALVHALQEELDHLMERAAAEWELLQPAPARALKAVYTTARREAKAAWKGKGFDRAIEFARAADALAHAAPVNLKLQKADKGEARRLGTGTAA